MKWGRLREAEAAGSRILLVPDTGDRPAIILLVGIERRAFVGQSADFVEE